MADQPGEPMNITDLPLPSRRNAPVETQAAAASRSATPFAKPPASAGPKSSAQRQREYRRRIAASRTPEQSIASRKSNTERMRNYRQRKAANWALASGSLEPTTASSFRSAGGSNHFQYGTHRQLINQQRQSLAAEPQTTVLLRTSSDRIEVSDELMDLTDLPLSSRSNAPVETQDAAASMFATPFAEPSTIAAPESSTQRQLSDCKEKWRNIRSAFLRSLKVSGNRAKRPYYLSKELNFILPYTKPHSTIQSNNDEQSDYNIFLEESENADVSNPESREYVELEIHPKITGSPLMTETKTYDHANFEPRHRSRRKRSMTEVESTFLDYIKCKKHKATTEGSSQLTQSPIQHFFQSLMPDVESMTNEQVRRFKIEVMLLIDKIKSNEMQ